MKIKPLIVHQASLSLTELQLIYGSGDRPPVMTLIEFGDNAKAHRKVHIRLTPDAIGEIRDILGAAVAKYEEAAAFARRRLNGT